ncbi:MAG TPA: 1,4-dihydroxy-2-naphthoate polyprenyltransferase [Gammaproteobacteria bacterium]|nr:1,4-dihydroxy-2-naphthoate polyprenyltransferase [Gammaproteobacteria bacterium]
MPAALRHWLLALRPKTLSVSVAPVLAGTALGWVQAGELSVAVMLAALAAALLIQIGTNLHNDVADHERGADDPRTRLGPPRATAEGWLTAAQVRRAAAAAFGLALVIGLYLVAVGGWPILLLGLASLAAGYLYTGGPRPLAYLGAGELFVLVFFGVVAVAGSACLQSGRFSLAGLLLGLLLGLPAAGVLVVNNHRDRDSDARAGKRTLAVRFGLRFSRGLYAACLLGPFLLLAPLQAETGRGGWLPWLALPGALWLVWRFLRTREPRDFNPLLGRTALFQLLLALLLAADLLAGPIGGG